MEIKKEVLELWPEIEWINDPDLRQKTAKVWEKALEEGYIEILKEAGALISNAGCAGCAAGQVGQNGPGEVTISTGNRNFAGKQGQGEVYLASPEVVACKESAHMLIGCILLV